MKYWSGTATTLALLFFSACSGSTQGPEPLPSPPAIIAFQADSSRITAGESVVLSWTAANATEVELLDQAGAPIEVTGTAANGSATVMPARTSFYVLKVKGEGGRDSAFVHVAVDEDLEEVFLVAIPTEIDSGGTAELLWSAPGAKSARIQAASGQEINLDAAAGAGILEVKPARTEAFTLVAAGVDAASPMTATTAVKVRPVLERFAASPQAANPGESITFTWTTRGASEVTISESTFGTLKTFTAPAEVDKGSWEWIVPDKLPNGKDPLVGHPLRFTLTMKSINPTLSSSASLDGFVGNGPAILEFAAPTALTRGDRFTLQWKTQNGVRLQIRANGDLIYEPLPGDANKVTAGAIDLAAPPAETEYELTLWGQGDLRTAQTRSVRVVEPPSITTFEAPGAIANVGDPAAIRWTTADATSVVVRVKGGPAVYASRDQGEAASGGASVYLGLSTTLVLEAFNDAGDVAREERTINVSNPALVSAQPRAATPGSAVGLTWDLQGTPLTKVVGDPGQAPVKTNPLTNFFDLAVHGDARPVEFISPDEALAKLEVPAGFRFPLPGGVVEAFHASTNGFVSFTSSGAQPENKALTAAGTAVPPMVAPFWDDLKLGATGKVLYLVEGTFPRRLIVQWNKVEKSRTDESAPSELTFQLQLWETGELRFAYQTLVGEGATGDSATIGWRKSETLAQEFSINQPTLAPQDELVFLSGARMTGQFDVVVQQSGELTLVGELANKNIVVFPAPVNVVKPGSVVINEVMAIGDPSTTSGQWVELLNVSSETVDLTGTLLGSTVTLTSWELPPGLVLAPGELVVVGESTVPAENGGAPVDLAWTGLTFDASAGEAVQLTALHPVSEYTLKAADLVAGRSYQRDRAIGSDGNPLPCVGTQPFSPNGALGTPGEENETCFDYTLRAIPIAFEDIRATGTPLFVPLENMDSLYTTIDLSSAPFPYFGAQKSLATVSANGWIDFDEVSTSSSGGNKLKPGTSKPVGAIAPFWDDIMNKRGIPTANIYVERRDASGTTPGRWIIQWEDFSYYTSGTNPEDILRFQAKLFDDGVIEFHYATMTSIYERNYASGNSATVWLERPAGDAALPVSINQPMISANTAYRYTPKP